MSAAKIRGRQPFPHFAAPRAGYGASSLQIRCSSKGRLADPLQKQGLALQIRCRSKGRPCRFVAEASEVARMEARSAAIREPATAFRCAQCGLRAENLSAFRPSDPCSKLATASRMAKTLTSCPPHRCRFLYPTCFFVSLFFSIRSNALKAHRHGRCVPSSLIHLSDSLRRRIAPLSEDTPPRSQIFCPVTPFWVNCQEKS